MDVPYGYEVQPPSPRPGTQHKRTGLAVLAVIITLALASVGVYFFFKHFSGTKSGTGLSDCGKFVTCPSGWYADAGTCKQARKTCTDASGCAQNEVCFNNGCAPASACVPAGLALGSLQAFCCADAVKNKDERGCPVCVSVGECSTVTACNGESYCKNSPGAQTVCVEPATCTCNIDCAYADPLEPMVCASSGTCEAPLTQIDVDTGELAGACGVYGARCMGVGRSPADQQQGTCCDGLICKSDYAGAQGVTQGVCGCRDPVATPKELNEMIAQYGEKASLYAQCYYREYFAQNLYRREWYDGPDADCGSNSDCKAYEPATVCTAVRLGDGTDVRRCRRPVCQSHNECDPPYGYCDNGTCVATRQCIMPSTCCTGEQDESEWACVGQLFTCTAEDPADPTGAHIVNPDSGDWRQRFCVPRRFAGQCPSTKHEPRFPAPWKT